MPKLFALLVAINDYHPKTTVPNLRGCVNDVMAMEAFLKKNYGEQLPDPAKQIKIIKNSEATKAGLIKAFQEHLCAQAKPGDVALFFYSGHGSCEDATPDFWQFDSNRLNETLVCHDSRLPGNWDLADKELAVLLSQIPDGAQRVVILDCCHSGSMTRSVDETATGGQNRAIMKMSGKKKDGTDGLYYRKLEDYLPGTNFYVNQKAAGNIEVPVSTHISMAACDRSQSALELPELRGLFSKTLIEVMEANGCRLSYSELAQQVRAAIWHGQNDQTPTLDSAGSFDANVQFLGTRRRDRQVWKVQFNRDRNAWQVLSFGAAQGMPIDPTDIRQVQFELWQGEKIGKTTTTASVAQVYPGETVLQVNPTGALKLDPNKVYNARLKSFPVTQTLAVCLDMKDLERKAIMTWMGSSPNAFLSFVPRGCSAPYELRIVNGQLLLFNTLTGQLVYGVPTFNDIGFSDMADVLGRIARWERLQRLSKPGSTVIDSSKFDVQLVYKPYGSAQRIDFKVDPGKDNMLVTLDYQKENGAWQDINTEIIITNRSDKEAYAAVVYQSRVYEIDVFRTSEPLQPGRSETIIIPGLYIGDDNVSEATETFKVFFSSKKLELGYYTQGGVPLGKVELLSGMREMRKSVPAQPAEDWFLRSIHLNLVRCEQSFDASRGANFAAEGISIKAHKGAKAKVSLVPGQRTTRSLGAVDPLAAMFMGTKDAELLSFNKATRSTDPGLPINNFIELNDIEGADKITDKNPLEITFAQKLKKNEGLLALTYDANTGLILPFGNWQTEKDGTRTLRIDKLPDAQPAAQKRSLGRALRFAVMKFVGVESVNMLRRVDPTRIGKIDTKGNPQDSRVKDGIRDKLAEPTTQKVLLMIHGIIGDTDVMAVNIGKIAYDKGYDLVLTFDYECLIGPIETIAGDLYKRLTDLGFGQNDRYELHILAHSMGGLISRYMLETLDRGQGIATRLIMCGTPNGGSVFGKLPKLAQTLQWLSGVAANFVPAAVPYLKAIAAILVKISWVTDKVTGTLAQMDSGSDFIKTLKQSPKPVKTDYLVLAGNIHEFEPPAGRKLLDDLIDKLEVAVGKLAYFGQDNDIAVSTADIKATGSPLDSQKAVTVACHHLNYFVHPPVVQILQDAL